LAELNDAVRDCVTKINAKAIMKAKPHPEQGFRSCLGILSLVKSYGAERIEGMVGAIDAVCDVAQRIIGKLKDGAVTGGPPFLGAAVGNGPAAYPLTPAMKRFADGLARQKGIKPPPGYKTSISIRQKFMGFIYLTPSLAPFIGSRDRLAPL
jgi:hypothetical protein